MTLSLDQFLRRFLLHVRPKGFVRIRNFGRLPRQPQARHAPTSVVMARIGSAGITYGLLVIRPNRGLDLPNLP